MSSPPTLRKRGGVKKDVVEPTTPPEASPRRGAIVSATAPANPSSEWDYWLAMFVMTVLAFATRFWMINYPDEVVFDEVHFGKVSALVPLLF